MVDRRAAAEELLRRQRVRGSLEELSKLCELIPAAHHRNIMKHLEQVTRREIDRLLVSAPPGSAKSQTASVLFPASFLANHPSAQIVTASHTQDLASVSAGAFATWSPSTALLLASSCPTTAKPPAAGTSSLAALCLPSAHQGRWLPTGPT
jgi:hypothetical protein